MTVVVIIFLPIVLAYQCWTYYVFRRRISREQFLPPAPPPAPARRASPASARARRAVKCDIRHPAACAQPLDQRRPTWQKVMTSSSSGPGRAAARSPATSPRRESGSCCLNAATGCPASRRTGPPWRSSRTAATSRPTTGTASRTSPSSSRRCTTSSAAPPSCTGPPCTACARRTSASCATMTACRPPGPSPIRTWSRTTPPPRISIRCTGRGGRTPPSRRQARPTRTPPSRTSRASSSSPMTWRSRATIRSTPRAGSWSTRPTCPTAPA